jgi:hypothetical protein
MGWAAAESGKQFIIFTYSALKKQRLIILAPFIAVEPSTSSDEASRAHEGRITQLKQMCRCSTMEFNFVLSLNSCLFLIIPASSEIKGI